MLKLPQAFLFLGNSGGVLHGSTCETIMCTLAAARDKALKDIGEDKITKLVIYRSNQTHYVLQKAAKLVGISPSNFRQIATSSSADFALSPNDVRMAMDLSLEGKDRALHVNFNAHFKCDTQKGEQEMEKEETKSYMETLKYSTSGPSILSRKEGLPAYQTFSPEEREVPLLAAASTPKFTSRQTVVIRILAKDRFSLFCSS
ncbi:hypothetical protein GIB67_022215 [Kingdonia uniflora]|uniref:tyrosine decarboxylase n=1 Tax=Kingdonia uniflora TaxID=39325 RepID=A0A7J7M6V7_9MAGN|nr:hypothetical protein GIB67_022215 [Kingdonia uniflora]